MAEKIKITVNGKALEVAYDTPLIQACRDAGAEVPTLCSNDNIPPYGVCRVCSVEVNEGRRTRVVPSCVYTVRREISVQTDTDRIHRHRAMLLNLLLARCPGEKVVQDLAAQYGVTKPHPRFHRKNDDCILCGLCVQTCRNLVGVAAIGFEGRGFARRVAAPFDRENPVCIACGACAHICPTQCIDFGEADGKRWLKKWRRETDMLVCEKCGNFWLPDAVAHVVGEPMGIDPKTMTVCPNCR
jgi:NADH dehydrogenase/NADH:ubiquinone oxidoreductase subunit G